MKTLSSNKELYQYMVSLTEILRTMGCGELSNVVALAARQSASMSAEFLGESRIALRQVKQEIWDLLSFTDQEDLSDVLKQLDDALDSRAPRS
jgi:hypothetical protein